MDDPTKKSGRTPPHDEPEDRDADERSKRQYGGLHKGLGYGGGRDIKDAERPARDIDFADGRPAEDEDKS